MPERIVAAFDRNTDQLKDVARELHAAKIPFRVILVISVLEFALVCVTFPSLLILKGDANQNAKTLRLVESALSPQQQSKQAAQENKIINLIVTCVDAHQARDTERILKLPLKAMPEECPDVTP